MSALAAVLQFHGGPVGNAPIGDTPDADSSGSGSAELRTLALRIIARSGLRGRDGTDSFACGPVALAVGHLHTTPGSGGTGQPVVDHQRDLAVVADIRLDNRAELVALLGTPPECGDAELVLKSYARWGIRCVEHLLGDFAFVVWDGREQQLFAARDPMGIKRLLLARTATRLHVGSEVAALLGLPGVGNEPDEGRIAEHLAGVLCSEHATVWKGVVQLAPAEAMTVRTDGATRAWRYWEPDVHAVIRHARIEDYAEQWMSLFTEAVRCRLRSSGPVLMDLSGGLDSSSVVSVAAMLRARGEVLPELHAASILSSAAGADERAHAAAVAKRWPMDWLRHTDDGPLPSGDLVTETARVMDLGPWPDDLGGVPLMERAAAIPGLRVHLTGQGGDFWCDGGGQTIADALARFDLRSVVGETRAWAGSDRPDRLLATLLVDGLNPLLRPRVPQRMSALRHPSAPWLRSGFVRQTELQNRIAHRDDRLAGRAFRSPSQRVRFGLVHDPMTQWGLLLDDRAGARRGIEERHPFHDRRLVEFALATPEPTRSEAGTGRRTQRLAMRGVLPDAVRTRDTKAEFSDRFARTFRDLLVPRLAAGLRTAERGWVDATVVQRQLAECLAADTWRPHCYPLAAVLGVELFVEAVEGNTGSVDGNGAAAGG